MKSFKNIKINLTYKHSDLKNYVCLNSSSHLRICTTHSSTYLNIKIPFASTLSPFLRQTISTNSSPRRLPKSTLTTINSNVELAPNFSKYKVGNNIGTRRDFETICPTNSQLGGKFLFRDVALIH